MTFRKILTWTVLAFAAILLLGVCYEQFMRFKTHRDLKPEGEMITIGNIQLHAIVKGIKSKKPTVVFEAGYYPNGASSLIWSDIQNEIAKHTRSISYDRSGLLWSETDDEINIEKTTAQLHELLKRIDGDGPFILVGHSISGLAIRAFAAKYPNLVKGMVFIDSSHPQQTERIPKELIGNQRLPNASWLSFLGEIGYLRNTFDYTYPGTKKSDAINSISNALFPENVNTVIKGKALKAKWAETASKKNNFGELPIKIIAANGEKVISEFSSRKAGEKYNSIWAELQTDMLALSTRTELILANNSGHYIPLEQPDLVIREILKILKEVEIADN